MAGLTAEEKHIKVTTTHTHQTHYTQRDAPTKRETSHKQVEKLRRRNNQANEQGKMRNK